jgi:hypothetical protein
MLQARLDLYMLGQCLFEDAMLLICSQLTTCYPAIPACPSLVWLVLTARSIGRVLVRHSEREGYRVFE